MELLYNQILPFSDSGPGIYLFGETPLSLVEDLVENLSFKKPQKDVLASLMDFMERVKRKRGGMGWEAGGCKEKLRIGKERI